MKMDQLISLGRANFALNLKLTTFIFFFLNRQLEMQVQVHEL